MLSPTSLKLHLVLGLQNCETVAPAMVTSLEIASDCINPNGVRGVSRISARGVLKVRPHTKSGGGGHTFVWHKENTLSLIINGYNFDARASNSFFNCIHS